MILDFLRYYFHYRPVNHHNDGGREITFTISRLLSGRIFSDMSMLEPLFFSFVVISSVSEQNYLRY